jgi:hypothetical protein
MKNIILFITLASLLFSCSSDSNSSSSNNGNNNGNSFTNSMDYEFTITINGVVHKVNGNSRDGIPSGTFGIGNISNKCLSINNSSFGASVQLGINDVTTPNYISGQNMQIIITLPNPLLGTNQASISFTGNYFDTLAASLGSNYLKFLSISSTLVTVNGGSTNSNIPIIITDLGTPTTLVNNGSTYSFGQTIKGNYSGTIYLSRLVNGVGIFYDIPVSLSIDFKALRLN